MRLSRLAAVTGLITVLLLVAVAVSWRQFAAGPAQAVNEAMAVDCDAVEAGIQASCTYPVGSTFQISVNVTKAPGGGYIAYQTKTRWTDATLNYLPTVDPRDENQWPVNCQAARSDNQPGDPSMLFTCFQFTSTPVVSMHVGSVVGFQMQCQEPGTTPIDLVSAAEDNQGGTVLAAPPSGAEINPALADASVTCQAGATATPPPGATPTPTPNRCRFEVAPALGEASVGKTGSFEVRADECADVAGAGFRVNFHPAVLRIDARTAGPEFPANCNVQVDTRDNVAGFVDFGCITMPLDGSDGGGLVARYSLTCQAEGFTALTLKETELVDSVARPLEHQVRGGSFACFAGQLPPTASPTRTPTTTPGPTDGPTTTPTLTPTGTPTGDGPTPTPTPTSTPTGVAPTATRTPTPAKACGDVDDSGDVSSIDAALALQRIARLVSSLPNEPSGDVDGDGEITSIDAAIILQFVAGLLDEMAC